LKQRLQRLRAWMKEEGLTSCLITTPVNLLYLTGLTLSAGLLWVTQRSGCLFVDGRYFEAVKDRAPVPVCALSEQKIEQYVKRQKGAVGFEADRMTFSQYQTWKKRGVKLQPIQQMVEQLRAVKERPELDKLRKAAELGSLGHDAAVAALREGMTERQVAAVAERYWLDAGGEDTAFSTIVAFGPNTAAPHHRAGERRLKKGDTVLIDLGVVLDGYCSDMTRVHFFGTPSAKMKKVYSIVAQAHAAGLDAVRSGVAAADVDRAARQVIEEAGFGKEFCHGLGHGVGLEVHELPVLNSRSKATLAAGHVVTVEPGIYLPGVGGVRLENTVIVTESGYEDLTCRPIIF
jgi:Xaa-Pro aminopeptidase